MHPPAVCIQTDSHGNGPSLRKQVQILEAGMIMRTTIVMMMRRRCLDGWVDIFELTQPMMVVEKAT